MGNQKSHVQDDYRKALTRFNRGKVTLLRNIFKELTEASVTPGQTIDKTAFLQYIPLPGMMGERLFAVFDRDGGGSIDFQEFLTGMALIYRGTIEEKKRFLFEMYDLDGDGVVTKEELFTMLTHVPAAFKILDATAMGVQSGSAGVDEAEEEDNRARIQQIVDAAFASKKEGEDVTFEEFSEIVGHHPAILEVLNIFYEEALPENSFGSRTSKITNAQMPHWNMWSTGPGLMKSQSTPVESSMLSGGGYPLPPGGSLGAAASTRAGTTSPSSTSTPTKKKNLVGMISSLRPPSLLSSSSIKSQNSGSGALGDVLTPQTSPRPSQDGGIRRSSMPASYCSASSGHPKSCPMCANNCSFNHCMLCGSALSSRKGMEYACEQCGWELSAINFCFQCGQPLRRVLGGNADARFGKVLSSDSAGSAVRNSGSKRQSPVGMSGYMFKVGRMSKMEKSRYFVLQDRFLYYYEKSDDDSPKGAIFLPGCTVETITHKARFGVVICTVSRKRQLFCNSLEEQQRWCAALTRSASGASIQEFYTLNNEAGEKIEIGRGKFATVVQGTRRDAMQERVAVKMIQKKETSEETREYLRTEIAVLKLVNHPNIVGLLDMFDEASHLYFVMEYMEGGDLLRRLLKLPQNRVSEPTARRVSLCLLRGLLYLHEHGITHRDIKPENALIQGPKPPDDDIAALENITVVKITDFGLSAITATGKDMTKPLGTVAYAAPEILMNKPYNRSVDVWSLGVVVFVMLGGEIPFRGKTEKEIAKAVVQGSYTYAPNRWTGISDNARAFIDALLCKAPADRLLVDKAIQHPWIVDASSSGSLGVSAARPSVQVNGELRVAASPAPLDHIGGNLQQSDSSDFVDVEES